MNNRNNLFLSSLLALLTLIGCNRIPDKSVFESLNVEELKTAITYDTSFASTYKYIKYLRDSIITSEIDRVKYVDLTYKRVHRLMKFSADTNFFKTARKKMDEEWVMKYGKYKVKIDSISDYWKKYKLDNSLDQYVKIELVRLQKQYYEYIGGIKDVQLGFKLTPLKGAVQQLRFAYRLEAKINEPRDEENSYLSVSELLDKSYCLSTSPFSAPVIRYWDANYRNKTILEGKTLEALIRDYNILIEVDEIRIDGRNLSMEDLNIPKSVEHHWEYEKKENLQDLCTKDIVKEILNEEYIPQYQYRIQETERILRKKDSLTLSFLQERFNRTIE